MLDMRPHLRKVIKLGRSALAVTLPKEWTSSIKLKEGDYVLMDDAEENYIKIRKADSEFEVPPAVCVINADVCTSQNMLWRIIIGAYMVGHKIIWIQTRNGFGPNDIEGIRALTEMLIGLHVTEQTDNIIILQSLADPSRPTIDSSIRRLHLISSSMYEMAIDVLLGEEDPKQLEDIKALGIECDKVYWLVTRQLLLSVNDRALAKELGIRSHLWLLGNRAVARMLKSIVTDSECIYRYVENLLKLGYKLDAETTRWFTNIREEIRKISNTAIDSLITRDLVGGNNAIESANKLVKVLEAAEMVAPKKYDVNICPSLSGIVRSLRNIVLNYRYIAEVAINRSVEESGEYVSVDTGSFEEKI
ncbi:MAG: phosphate uptake regulator PhoU [Nitrososphaerota archaeon]